MMAERHPDELELLSYVEGELDDAARPRIEAHVEACERCSADVRALESARGALRAAPLLEFPAERRKDVLAGLPAPDRAPSARRVLALVAPIAAALALTAGVAVVATRGGGGGNDEGAGGAAAERSSMEASTTSASGGGSTAAAGSDALAGAAPVRSVAGPPKKVAQTLRDAGYRATLAGGAVVVRGASKRAVRRALGALRPGDVPVYVK